MRVAAFFCMKLVGHLHRTLPLVSRLGAHGVRVVAFTHADYRREVEAAGAEHFDMLGRFPLEGVDDATTPRSVRYVTYAARHGRAIAEEVRRLGASLVLSDTFAVVGRAVAAALGLPHANLCAGHAPDPAAIEEDLRRGGFVRLSPRCLDGVRRLRDEFGLAAAHPFMHVADRSPFLNVHGEPPEFLDGGTAPAAFFGSVPDDWGLRGAGGGPAFPARARLRICVSFGTMIWNYYPDAARDALRAIGEAVTGIDGAHAIVSVGRGGVMEGSSSVDVRPWIDPWHVLREAHLLVTHHGLNSTHEAIALGVPMLSLPFLWDQPALARKCQALGLALPLAASGREPLAAAGVRRAVEAAVEAREAMLRSLDRARAWELGVMAGRDAVAQRICRLPRGAS